MREQKDFEDFYLKHYSQVYGYIFKKIPNEQIAEDLTMDAFYSCWVKFNTFDESKASFQTWLFVIVNNKLKNYYRDHKDTAELDDLFIDCTDQAGEVLDAIQLQYLRDHLYNALKELNETQRSIVIYRYFKDMNASEIAVHMGLSHGSVRIHLKRALDKIRDYFDKNNIRWE